MVALAREFLEGVYTALGYQPPDFGDEDIAAALERAGNPSVALSAAPPVDSTRRFYEDLREELREDSTVSMAATPRKPRMPKPPKPAPPAKANAPEAPTPEQA